MGGLLPNRNGAPVPSPNRSAYSPPNSSAHDPALRRQLCAKTKSRDRSEKTVVRLYPHSRPVNSNVDAVSRAAPRWPRDPARLWSVLGCMVFLPTAWTTIGHLCVGRARGQRISALDLLFSSL